MNKYFLSLASFLATNVQAQAVTGFAIWHFVPSAALRVPDTNLVYSFVGAIMGSIFVRPPGNKVFTRGQALANCMVTVLSIPAGALFGSALGGYLGMRIDDLGTYSLCILFGASLLTAFPVIVGKFGQRLIGLIDAGFDALERILGKGN